MKNLKEIYKTSSGNKTNLNDSEKCGCFHCIEIFDPKLITEWVHAEETAICPKCGIDSIVPQAIDVELTKDLLGKMYLEYFNY
jgi:hypothetical protein